MSETKNNSSPLTLAYEWFAATEAEDHPRMDVLLAQGVPVDVPHPLRHTTALMEATRRGRATTVNWLLDRRATPAFLCGPELGTPIHCALKQHRWEIAQALLEAAPSAALVDEHGRTPLHILAGELADCPNIRTLSRLTNLLVEKSCPLDVLDAEDIAALHYAVVIGHLPFTELLLAHGANVNVASPVTGVSPLIIAAIDGNQGIASLLLEYGANPLQPMSNGQTPIALFPPLITMAAGARPRQKTS